MSARVSSGSDSKQDYGTPPELIRAIEHKFGKIEVDLAASAGNTVAPVFVTPEMDSLKLDWYQFRSKLCFLNPPFADIEPWAIKCAGASELKILFLTPASVDSNWWESWVHHRAYVKFLKPRLKFVGANNPYPKACSISCYGFHCDFRVANAGNSQTHWYEPWVWKQEGRLL